MNIVAVQYSLADRAYDIFVAGCTAPHCAGCHNPELWSFDVPGKFDVSDVVNGMEDKVSMFDHIRIMGGEPLDQEPEQLMDLLRTIRTLYPFKKLWLFTRYSWYCQIPQVVKYVDYVKHGKYLEHLPSYICPITGITLASSNQFVVHHTLWSDGLKG